MKIKDAIKTYQEANNLNDAQFARLLNIDRSMLSKIKSGEREPGVKVIKALLKHSPEFRKPISDYLLGEDRTLDILGIKENRQGLRGLVARIFKR